MKPASVKQNATAIMAALRRSRGPAGGPGAGPRPPVRRVVVPTSALVEPAPSFQVRTRIPSLAGSAGVRGACDREGGTRARLRLLGRRPARGRRAGGGARLGADRGEVERGRGAV